jgi:hypothetical protein
MEKKKKTPSPRGGLEATHFLLVFFFLIKKFRIKHFFDICGSFRIADGTCAMRKNRNGTFV